MDYYSAKEINKMESDRGINCLGCYKRLRIKLPSSRYKSIRIPDKHGDLIDSKSFFKRVQEQTMALWGKDTQHYQYLMGVLDMIKNEPVIVEASDGNI